MKTIKRFTSGVVLFFAAITLFSCNLEDFNLRKLADPNDIIPDVFAPLAYGTFKVKDLVPIPIPDNFPVPSIGLPLDSVVISKAGTSFRTSAIDSVYLISHVTNESPVDMEFKLSFINKSTGLVNGKTFPSGKIPANTKDFRIQFNLGPTDQDILQNSSDIKLSFQISSPDAANPILYKAVKNTMFTIKISFYAPVKLWELTK